MAMDITKGAGSDGILTATDVQTTTLTLGGTAVTATAAEINLLDGTATAADLAAASAIKTVTVTAANGGANQVDVTIQVVDPDAASVAEPTMVFVWLSDLTTGLGGSAHTHSTAPAFGTGEEITEFITNDSWLVLTDASGTAVLNLIDTANEDVTVNAQVPGSGLVQDTTVAGDWSA